MKPIEQILTSPRVKDIVARGPDGAVFIMDDGLRVILSIGGDWDHISVSRAHRVPTYSEMQAVKRLCFKDDEWAMELHAPVDLHINTHPYVLHLWRPQLVEIPHPPTKFV